MAQAARFRSLARTYTLKRPNVGPAAPALDYASLLNAQQCAAATAAPGPALVIAGAGSGKTRTLTYRVAYLLENGISPQQILLLTFTNKAAKEMLARVADLLPDVSQGIWGGTFHSIGNRILRRHAEAAGYKPGFSIMDREDQEDLLKLVFTSSGLDPKDKRYPKPEVLGDIFSMALNTGLSIEEVLLRKYDYFVGLTEEITRLQGHYERRKVALNVLDFDDLLDKCVRLLKQPDGPGDHYRRQFQFVLVDEYQDTNKLQAEFIDLLARDHKNLMVVGDDAQSIYSWRGADVQNILDFPQRYPGAAVHRIEVNYRSTPQILELANAAIAHNTRQFEKTLVPARPPGPAKPALVELMDGGQQALFVTQRILEMRDEGIELAEMAVLYRAHFHALELQLELTRHGVPFHITSGLRFFEQAHIKDVISFLKFAVNPRDEVAFKRVVRLLPGIGGTAADKLWRHFEESLGPRDRIDGSFHEAFAGAKVGAKSAKAWTQLLHTFDEIAPGGHAVPPQQALESVVEAVYDDYAKSKFPNYDQRREDLVSLANFARQFSDPAEFLAELALVSAVEQTDATKRASDDDERVTLSSVHQAKGLEWKVVFVIGLNEGAFPSHRSAESPGGVEEERRLFYVAVTRACDELILTYPNMRTVGNYGGDMFQRPSRFLDELPMEVYERWEVERGW